VKRGDTVKIKVGPLAGRQGIIVRLYRGQWMVRLSHLPYDLPYQDSELEALPSMVGSE